MNPYHGNYKNPLLWEATGKVVIREQELKCGCFSLTTIKQIKLPVINTAQKIRAAIYCALATKTTQKFQLWAKKWLDGTDRSYAAAAAASASAVYIAASSIVYTAAAAAYAAAAADFNLVAILERAIREEIA
jgi:hypothetical protein